MGDTGVLCAHCDFKAENKILTFIHKAQNGLELFHGVSFSFFKYNSQAHRGLSALVL